MWTYENTLLQLYMRTVLLCLKLASVAHAYPPMSKCSMALWTYLYPSTCWVLLIYAVDLCVVMLTYANPLVQLYMRTVLLCLKLAPALTDFAMGILQRLISKQVHKSTYP